MAHYGSDGPKTREFSSAVLADLARVTSGRPNTRGGTYEASLFVYRAFIGMGRRSGATPDGRLAGEPLSPGMSPSPSALSRHNAIAEVLRALEPLDLTAYPVVAVLDMKLPLEAVGGQSRHIVPILRRFLDAGGSVLQLNVVDPAVLEEARRHPERHGDLVVRVSGYSARFTTLPEGIQDEIIQRSALCT
jgi:formate C-acetyltransferase